MKEKAISICIKHLGDMKQFEHLIGILTAALLAGALSVSCIYDDGEEPAPEATIRVHTLAVDGDDGSEEGDNTFMVLFWKQTEHLETDGDASAWQAPYLAGRAPQPVAFYKKSAFDTHYPYPMPEGDLYATGYAPGKVLAPDATQGYRRLAATVEAPKKGRSDFLGCDYWNNVFRGSLQDPFAQEKNKLYFRHLAAKLVFHADRDRESMENKQYVRNVQIGNLQMSIDGGQNWTAMYTPSAFEWKLLSSETDFTESYKRTIAAVLGIPGNEGAKDSAPSAGYKTAEAETFAGAGSGFVLQKGNTDRVPIDGMAIDSCYVCNPMADGEPQTNQPIRLKMDIRAEMSFDPNFPKNEEGSDASDLTFTREWKGVELKAIHEVEIGADGEVKETERPVELFKAGNEYRIYIHFHRTGVNLAARELPWNFSGPHYIVIPGGDKPAEGGETDAGDEPAAGNKSDTGDTPTAGDNPGSGDTPTPGNAPAARNTPAPGNAPAAPAGEN